MSHRPLESLRLAAAALFSLAAVSAWSAPAAVIEAVQFPAWLERGGLAVPAAAGVELQPRDVVRTGGNGRAQLLLAEGSLVKLGERSQFAITKAEPAGTFRAALDVVAGAFRFTTSAINKAARRDVQIKVKNVTVGIRGTDLWGKAAADRDFVVLLEGSITVGSAGNPTETLTRPLEVYTKPATEPPTLSTIDAEKVQALAQETELSPEGPIGRKGGTWRVIVALYDERNPALALNRAVRASGYPSEIVTLEDGRTSVQLRGFATEAEARSAMADLRSVPGVNTPSVRQN